ncbi:MAG: AmmeMemoRadiSam system protein A [SAR324 cluster bacterium]|nr:AmmeMemoRadiSam system protein A [SAR324 cluster bacterium]
MESSLSKQTELSSDEKRHLLKLAKKSILHGLKFGSPAEAEAKDLEGLLAEKGASFVTLHKANQLRGCIGFLEAKRPLAIDVLENAYSSAFRDSRFPPLQEKEMGGLDIKISVLSRPVPMEFGSEADLIRMLQPGIDGLILSEGNQRGTFLPSVWSDLSSPQQFLQHLKRKAGFSADYWSSAINVERYSTVEFGDDDV